MVLSTSQQAVIGFTAVLFTFVVLPRMFGVGIGTGGATKETRFDRFNRKVAPGPGAVRGQPVGMNAPGSAQTMENMQHMKMMMEQEMKNEKFKPNSNKGYVFTLMPLYAIGVGVFAAYKFLKIKHADNNSCQAQKSKVVKGAKKSAEAETQLNELEQRLGQTERMLNSILTQLDPLTNCVKTVAQEQKNEIMSQLQTIRYLMKKRGMDCPPVNIQESSCDRNLDDLIKSLAAHETLASDTAQGGGGRSCAASDAERSERSVSDDEYHKPNDSEATDEEEEEEEEEGETDGQTLEECKREVKKGDGEEEEEEEEEEGRKKGGEEEAHEDDLLPSIEDSDDETHIEDIGAEQQQPPCGLRRRAARPE